MHVCLSRSGALLLPLCCVHCTVMYTLSIIKCVYLYSVRVHVSSHGFSLTGPTTLHFTADHVHR